MGTKSRIMYVSILCIMAVLLYCALITGITRTDKQGETVIATFAASGARFLRMQVNGWRNTPDVLDSERAVIAYFNARSRRLWQMNSAVHIARDNGNITLNTAGFVQPHIYGTYTLVVRPGAPKNSCEVLSLQNTQSPGSHQKMADILISFLGRDNNHMSTVVSGSIGGRVGKTELQNRIDEMIKASGSEAQQTISDGRLVSISAYAPRVTGLLTGRKKSVNINMSFRYNSVEDNTFVYVGSPIITSEY